MSRMVRCDGLFRRRRASSPNGSLVKLSRLSWFSAVAWPIAVFIVTGGVFFRTFLRSGFDVFRGGSDARFAIFIREHFLQFLAGKLSLTSPPMFFPVTDTLGYSDVFLLDALIYVPARLLGADPFLSFQLTEMVLSLIGFVSFNIMLTRYASVRQPLAAVAAAVFTFSNALFISVGRHPQLLEVNFCPLVVVLALEAARSSEKDQNRAVIAGFAGGIILGLLFSTGYYVAWYFTLISTLSLAVFAVLQHGAAWTSYARTLRGKLFSVAAFGFGFAIGTVPFCIIYRPIIALASSRSFVAEYMQNAPGVRDLVNVGIHNVVWGRILDFLNIIRDRHFDSSEFVLAITPILLVTYLGCAFVVLRRRVLARPQDQLLRNAFLASFAAFAVVIVTMVNVRGHSLFWLEWHLVPGARATRFGGRAQIVLNGVAAAGTIMVLMHLLQTKQPRWAQAALWILPLLFLIEQINDIDNDDRLSRSAEVALITAPSAPAECKSFFISPHDATWEGVEQVDAILIAQVVGVPTLNGYSGWSPPDWRMDRINKPNYFQKVWDWAKQHGITEGLCQYDFAARQWQSFAQPPDLPRAPVRPGTTVDFRSNGNGDLIEAEGWSDPEGPGTWTNSQEAGLVVKVADWPNSAMALEVAAQPFLVEHGHPSLEVEVLANGELIEKWKYDVAHDNKLVTRLAIIPVAIVAQASLLNLTFRIHDPMAPSDAGISTARRHGLFEGISADPSRLGLFVSRISFFRVQNGTVVRDRL